MCLNEIKSVDIKPGCKRAEELYLAKNLGPNISI